jgi:hypothetical protein
MRSTHFIGLTAEAEEYVKNLNELKSDTVAVGLHDKISLRKWELPEKDFKFSKKRNNTCLREVVQETPWSSGPMIFTCLEADYGNGGKGKFLQWTNDPRVMEKEFDKQRGKFWV